MKSRASREGTNGADQKHTQIFYRRTSKKHTTSEAPEQMGG